MEIGKVEKLIEIVRGHHFLYDVDHPQYKNANLKSEIWDSIGRDLNISGEAARNKWKTVRDGYTKHKKQVKTSRGSSKKNVSYIWASQLAFLDNPKAFSSNVSLDAAQPSPRTETHALDFVEINTQDMTSRCNSPLSSTSSSSQVLSSSQIQSPQSPATTSRGSHRNNKRSVDKRSDDEDVGSVLQFLNTKKKREYDAVDNLFLSYADTFKKFPPREQAIVKLELAKLFFNMESQLLDNN